MFRNKRFAVIALAMAGLFIAGCTKSGGSTGDASTATKGKPAGAAVSALDFMPENTAILIGVNFKKLAASKLWAQYGGKLTEDPEAKATVDAMKAECGFDYATDIDSMVVGVPAEGDSKNAIIVIKGKFDQAKLAKCATVAAAKAKEPKKLTIATTGNISEISVEGETKKAFLGWAGTDTLVIATEAMEKGDKAPLEAILAKKTSAKNNKDLASILTKVNTGETIWVAGTLTGKLAEQAPSLGDGTAKPTGGWLNLAYQKDFSLEAALRFPAEKDAKSTVDTAVKELEGAKSNPQIGAYLKTFKGEAKGNDAIFTLSLTEKEVDDLVAQAGAMLPMLMMMGMGGMGGGGGGM